MLRILIFFSLIGAVGCDSSGRYKFTPLSAISGAAKSPVPSIPVPQTPTPLVSPIPATPTSTPVASATPTPVVDPTPVPTPTATAIPTPVPTPTPTPVPTPTPDPNAMNEVFDAPDTGKSAIDILFVIDNSSSMQDDQDKIAQKFPKFTEELKSLDWQIGITTTDVTSKGADGIILPYHDENNQPTKTYVLRPGMTGKQASFENTIHRDEVGSPNEMGIKAALHSLQKRNTYPNNTLFRNNSIVSVIIISDEDENSNATGRGEANSNFPGIPKWTTENEPKTLVNYANTLNFNSFSVSSITIMPGDKKCKTENSHGFFGNVYKELVQMTGGYMGDICSKDFSVTLKEIAKNILAPLTVITLSKEPEPNSVNVILTPDVPGLTFTVSGNQIKFNKTIPLGTKIKVTYRKYP